MYLYEKTDDSIRVHELEPKHEDIYLYKKKQMEQLQPERRVFKASSNYEKFLDLVLKLETREISYPNLDNRENGICGGVLCSRFEPCSMTDKISKLLDKYYRIGMTSMGNTIKIKDSKYDDISYILVTEPYYSTILDNYVIENIINIPKSLYLFEAFLRNGLFSIHNMNDDEIIRILNLFNFKENVSSVALDELKKAYYFGVVENHEALLNEKIRESNKVLSLIKK